MDKPKVNRSYVFVRVRGDQVQWAHFVRHHDGSASVFRPDLNTETTAAAGWKDVLLMLQSEGFVTQAEAVERSLITAEWAPRYPAWWPTPG